MPTPFQELYAEIFQHHRQIKQKSCVPCATEYVLKVYKELKPESHPLQTAFKDEDVYGWDELRSELKAHNIEGTIILYDFPDMWELATNQFNVGTPIIFSWPTLLGFNPNLGPIYKIIDYHMFTAYLNGAQLVFAGFDERGFSGPPKGMLAVWSEIKCLCPDYKVEVFVHHRVTK